jgi:hypothetical protein
MLQNGNNKPSIPIAHAVHMESYGDVRHLVKYMQYDKYYWHVFVRTSAWFPLWMRQPSMGRSSLRYTIVTSANAEFRTKRKMSPFNLWLWFYSELAPLAWESLPSPRVVTPWSIVCMMTCTLGQRLFMMKPFYSSGGEVQVRRSCCNRFVYRSL